MTATSIGILIRILALVIMGVGVIPKAYKESKVPNGLGRLRRTIFVGHLFYYASQTFHVVLNFFSNGSRDDLSKVLTVSNSVSFLIIAIILHLIYHQDYGRLLHSNDDLPNRKRD